MRSGEFREGCVRLGLVWLFNNGFGSVRPRYVRLGKVRLGCVR